MDVDYPERSPLDLIEEDKRVFACHRILRTYFGGLRLTYDEVDQVYVHWALYPLQIIIYLTIPALVLIFTRAFEEDYSLSGRAVIEASRAIFVLLLALNLMSYCLEKRGNFA